jgi:hypothetical protein
MIQARTTRENVGGQRYKYLGVVIEWEIKAVFFTDYSSYSSRFYISEFHDVGDVKTYEDE